MAKSVMEMEVDSYNRAYCENLYVEELTDNEYIVTNVDHNSVYIVYAEGDYIMNCTCPHHVFRGVNCKHMVKVSLETDKNLL